MSMLRLLCMLLSRVLHMLAISKSLTTGASSFLSLKHPTLQALQPQVSGWCC